MASNCAVETRIEPLNVPYQLEWAPAPRGSIAYIGQYQFSVGHLVGYTDIAYQKGRPIRYSSGGTWSYGIVKSYSAGTVTISGIAIVDINHLAFVHFAPMQKATMMTLSVNGQFADAANQSLIQNDLNTEIRWSMGKAYCIEILHKVEYLDTGASQPRINGYRARPPASQVPLGLGNFSEGLNVALTWASTGDVASSGLNPSNYDIENGDILDIGGNAQGTNNDARDLTVVLVFVYE